MKKYKNKFTGKIVAAIKIETNQKTHILSEGKHVFKELLSGQWLIRIDEQNEIIMNNDIFESTYDIYRELLLD